jgi:hypothetical protein
MDADLIRRLNEAGERLHRRALALAHPGQDEDMSVVMSSLALSVEALRVLGEEVNRLRAARQ